MDNHRKVNVANTPADIHHLSIMLALCVVIFLVGALMRHFIFRLAIAFTTFSLGVIVIPKGKVIYPQTSVSQSISHARQRQIQIKLPPIPRDGILDVAVLDNDVVWAVGLDSHDSRIMWHSNNGGQTWETRIAPTEGWVLHSIHFVDQQHGWATGSGNALIRTSDGGKSWERLKLPIYMSWIKVHFVNSQIGYVAGGIGYKDRRTDNIVYGIEILQTVDGGKSWRVCYKDNQSGDVWNIATLSEKIAIVAIDGQTLLRTQDGGRTWKFVATHKRAGFKHVVFNSDGVGWAVGEKSFYRSNDQGKTWQTPDNLPQTALTHDWGAVDFANTNLGIAVSEDCAIVITYDGGKTWQEIKTNLHQGNIIRANSFAERLRGVHLHGDAGIISGSQMLYRIESFE